MTTDRISILEAAYSLSGSETEWLALVAEAVRGSVTNCSSLAAHAYDSNTPLITSRSASYRGVEQTTAITMLCQLCELVKASGDDALGATIFAKGAGEDGRAVHSRCDNTAEMWPSLSPSIPKDFRLNPKIFQKSFVTSLASARWTLHRAGFGESQIRDFDGALGVWFRRWGLADELWVNAQDPTGVGCCLVALLDRKTTLHPRDVHQWHCVASHVASAFRVRRQLAGSLANANVDSVAEAILRPDGKVEHAQDPARGDVALATLRRSVRAMDQARTALRRHSPDRALALWEGLVAGRWSLLDHFDSDGRRYIVACRNDSAVPDERGLSLRERQVMAHAALGHSNKVIAYELGLSTSTVACYLARARLKLQSRLGVALQTDPAACSSGPPASS